ncbi:hypothetical protein R1sor_019990 [Riccia sorocarpa]|uniref:Tetratricopeptide repeat protein 37 n=1 Tax=Riccia sorocarpa TaxID=122646 RepID=A0ABD3IE26_9MARC
MGDEKVSLSAALRAAQDALTKRQFQEVVKQCKVVLKQDRKNYDGYILLGSALLQLQQHAQAEKALRLAIGINSSKMAAWQRLVEIYDSTGDSSQLIEACEEARDRAQAFGKQERYEEYTQKLASAFTAVSDFKKASVVLQELLDNPSTSETVRFQALCGLVDAKAALLDKAIQDECHKRLSQNDTTSSSFGRSQEGLTTGSVEEDVMLKVEEKLADEELSKELEEFLRTTTCQVGSHLERHHELLLRLLLRHIRAARHSSEDVWRKAKLETLQQCSRMILSHMSMSAFEVAFRILEDDDGKHLQKELTIETSQYLEQQPLIWLGRWFAHTYPGHGIALAALGYAMHCSTLPGASLERKRVICEKALRLDDSCVTGWQVLAEVHFEQNNYTSAAECIRRGLQALSTSRARYGLGLSIPEAKLNLTWGQTCVATENLVEAETAFKLAAEVSKGITGKDGTLLLASADEGLAKLALVQGNVSLACEWLAVVLDLNPDSHWALSEQGWLAYQQGDWKRAIQCLEHAVELQPGVATYHFRLGLLYWKAGGSMPELLDKVLPELLQAVKLDPSQSDVFRLLGHCYNHIFGDPQRAIRCYQKAVTLNYLDEEAGEVLCDLLDQGGQEILEEDICKSASQKSRRAFWAWRRLGLLQVLHKEWSEAVPNLQHALRGYVTDGDLWEALGLAYQHLGMLTAALKAYGRAINLGEAPSVFALMQSGNILLLLGSFDKALEIFQEALKQVPSHVGALCGLGAAVLGRARQCMSIGAFTWSAALVKVTFKARVAADALDLLQASVPICSSVGAFWKLLGDLEVTYAQAVPSEELEFGTAGTQKLSPEVSIQSAIDMWNKQRLNSLRRARVFYQRALHLSPSQGSLYSDLGLTLDLISFLDPEKSSSGSSWLAPMTALCGGLRVEGDKPDLWVTLGMLSKHKGLRQHCFIQALRIDGNHALSWGGLGQLYLKEGQEALAREAFDRARSANPALPIPWAGMAYVHSLVDSPKDIQEAYASCLYAFQLSPTTEVQLGLGVLAARTKQLHAVEVYTALQQAVHHAPHRPEAHNLQGLSCESRGDFGNAIKAFRVACSLLDLSRNSGDDHLSEKELAVRSNLARVLCKAGAYRTAIQEYEMLGDAGLFRDDSGALRGYGVALWQEGLRDKAVLMARKSMEVELEADTIIGGQTLLVKMIYGKSGVKPALLELKTVSSDVFLDVKFCLTALAVAALSGDEQALCSLTNACQETLGHDGLIQAQLLIGASKQMAGNVESRAAIQILQKALHLFPQSGSVRARLGKLLLESSSGKKAALVPRCCHLPYYSPQLKSDYAALFRVQAEAACACAVCGQLKCFKFSPCNVQREPGSSLIHQLQRWAHTEPWNVEARYLLVLCLMQQARAESFPLHLCKAIYRTAVTTVSLLREENSHFHAVLTIIIAEVRIHLTDGTVSTQLVGTVTELKKLSHLSPLVAVQLARCAVSQKDYRSLQAELSRAGRLLSADDVQGWFAVLEMQHRFKMQEVDSSFKACKEAISRRPLDEQQEWIGLLHVIRVKRFLQDKDFLSAQKAAEEALSFLANNPVLHLLHGTICAMLVSSGTSVEMLPSAVRSLNKAMNFEGPGSVPLACIVLCQMQNLKSSSKNSEISKWERKLWKEWEAWPPQFRPAELYFQMGLLAQKAQGTLVGMAGTAETSWTVRAWMQRAVHLEPDRVLYWSYLGASSGRN